MKNYIKQFTMKKDLYRFAKARKNKRKEIYKLTSDEIKLVEYNYYKRFNANFYKQNKITTG